MAIKITYKIGKAKYIAYFALLKSKSKSNNTSIPILPIHIGFKFPTSNRLFTDILSKNKAFVKIIINAIISAAM